MKPQKADKKEWAALLAEATFLERPNRFIAHCRLVSGEVVVVHVPNPGRMWELLLPGVQVFLADHRDSDRKTKWSMVAILREGHLVMIDTGHTNRVAEELLERGKIPSLAEWRPLRREVKVGASRFDFLLGNGAGDEMLLEVKSCTLFGGNGAMFPDAPTERGKKHLLHLAEAAESGQKVGVLLIAQWLQAEWFMPDYHTDPEFAQTMLAVKDRVKIVVAAIGWDENLQPLEQVKEVPILWSLAEKENMDSGCYLVLMNISKSCTVKIGALGDVEIPQGWYVYCGSAKKTLNARLNRHLRIRKGIHWHMDYLRQKADKVVGIPIRTQDGIEHDLARGLAEMSEWKIDGFGCSDCQCSAHLFGFSEDPRKNQKFVDFLLYWRISRFRGEESLKRNGFGKGLDKKRKAK